MRIPGEKHMRALLLARLLSCSWLIFSGLTFAAEPLLLEEARLVPSDSSPPGFGRSVAIDGDVAVVGATDGGGMPEQGTRTGSSSNAWSMAPSRRWAPRHWKSLSTATMHCAWKRMAINCAPSWKVGWYSVRSIAH